MFEGHHYQVAYVTRDLNKAVADFKAKALVRHETYFDVEQPVVTPEGPATMGHRLALLWVGNLQYEFIQPKFGLEHIYGPALTDDGTLGFHHICARVSDWEEFRRRVDQQPLPLAFEGEAGPLKFLYLDARAACGHYLEYTWMPDEMWAGMGGL